MPLIMCHMRTAVGTGDLYAEATEFAQTQPEFVVERRFCSVLSSCLCTRSYAGDGLTENDLHGFSKSEMRFRF